MKIAVAQINPTVGDIEYNKNLIIEQIAVGKAAGADLVVFPEMAICGMPTYDLIGLDGFVDNSLLALAEISEYVKGIEVLVGSPTKNGDDFFSTVFHIKDGEIDSEFSKAMVTSRDEIGNIAGIESESFPEGEFLENIIVVDGEKILVAIGEDLSYIEDLEVFDDEIRFAAVINPTADRYYHYSAHERYTELQRLANMVETPIITSNLVGGNCDTIYYGGSAVFTSEGALIMKAKSFEEDMIVIESEDIDEFKDISNKKPTPKSKMKDVKAALILGIRDYFRKSGFSKACLGLSGGVDSALVAALAVEALGAENVDAILMPSQFSSQHSVDDAIELAKNLGIKHHIVNIEDIYNSYMSALNPIFGELPFSVAEENLQSRIRGVILMAYSNKFGNIVLNTTNKCEAAMGYGTLYGDTNGAISLLGDLYKGEVYDLCRLINSNEQIIPNNILTKAPSAELRPDQKDSDSLPDYTLLDKLLYCMIEDSMNYNELLAVGFEPEVVNKVIRLFKTSEHKRHQIPPVMRLSKIVLGKDIILPLAAKL